MAEGRVVCTNRKARHDYFIEATYEAGIVLWGTEVKALREGRANLKDSYAKIKDGEVWLYNCHISPYRAGGQMNHDPLRVRKLLLHRREIRRLVGRTSEMGYTLVPLSIYFTPRGLAKVELALARGKKSHDKRQALKEREARLEIERALRRRR